MSSIKIQNLPTLKPIDAMKIPTGGFGDYAVTIGEIAEHFKLNGDFATDEELYSHTSNKNNPHNVTKYQVGLEHADNTSDLNKPVSTAQQQALDLKADKATTYTKSEVDSLDDQLESLISAYANTGNKAYKTLAEANTDKANIPANSSVYITNDPTSANNGLYQYDGTSFVKSTFDPLTQAKAYSDSNKIFKPQPISEPTDFNTITGYGMYYFFSGATWDSSPNKPPFNNQWAYMLVMPVSTSVVAQYVWSFNSQKITYRFRNASNVWSGWLTFSDDTALTTLVKTAVNLDIDSTFDARTVNSINPIFESLSKNFFDKNSPLLMNRRINQFGNIEEHTNSVTTSLISVAGMSSIVVSGLTASTQAYRAYRFLDKDKKWLSNAPIDLNQTAKVITVPTNAMWFQLTLKDGIDTWTLNLDTIQLEVGIVSTAYTAYIRGKLKSIYAADFYVDPAQVYAIVEPVFESLSKNIFDKSSPLLYNYRITAQGVLQYHLNSVTTQPIYIRGLNSLTVSGLTPSSVAYRAYRFLDKDKNWISNAPVLLNATGVTASTIPANAVYFQICLKDGIDTWSLNLDTIQIESGSVATTYEAYVKGDLKALFGTDIASSGSDGGLVSRAFGAKYLFFGDSITQTSRVDDGIFDETTTPFPNWPTYAKEQLQMSAYRNYAKSGAAFREYGQTNLWQMMSHQVNTAITNAETPDIIITAMGTNDGLVSLGDYETAMSKATLNDLDRTKTLEAARWAFWTIKKNFPNAVCFYANPLQRASADSTELSPLIDGLSKMALRYGFTLIDQHHECGIIRDLETGSQHLYLADGLHPNTAGRILQANYIVSKLIGRMAY
jgi:Lysophospholipase L1 and related esterases